MQSYAVYGLYGWDEHAVLELLFMLLLLNQSFDWDIVVLYVW